MVHLRYDTPVTRFYNRVVERRGWKAALVAAAPEAVDGLLLRAEALAAVL
jgi:hypothetical protein